MDSLEGLLASLIALIALDPRCPATTEFIADVDVTKLRLFGEIACTKPREPFGLPLSTVLGAIPSFPRPVIERLVARMIERLDEEDGGQTLS